MTKMVDVDLSDSFLCESEEKLSHVPREAPDTCDILSDFKPGSLSKEQLIAEQGKDVTLTPLFDSLVTSDQGRF